MRGLVSGFVLVFVASGCSGDSSCPNGNCIDNDGGGDGNVLDSSDLDVPQGCDLTADITASPKCIDDGIGVFVDGNSGDDTNTGSMAKPFKTIAKGISAAGAKPRIYVCTATYAEDISLNKDNAVSIFGGLKCGAWSYDGTSAIVGKTNLALHVDGVTKVLALSDLTFKSADGVAASESSTAAFVNASTDVTLRRVVLRPGAGKAGAAGTTGSNWTSVAPSDATIAGHAASGATGGTDHSCGICTDGKNSMGGGGGTGTSINATGGHDGTPNLSGLSPNDGKGGTSACTAGDNGAPASLATAAPGAAVLGKLTSAGWSAGGGQDGPNGSSGQGGGGGGGGANITSPGGGGGGGCGGCGGAGGKAGGAGGGSIALAVVSSKVTLAACDIVTVAGGAGGTGSAGQDGQLGGYAGAAVSPGCAGGIGGQGGKGGAGGGGAGGISVGILYTDQKPVFDQSTSIVVPTTAATKGAGGAAGTNDGIDGVCQASMQASST